MRKFGALSRDAPDHFSDQEKCRFYTLGGENVEDFVGVARDWLVVEGKYDLLIGKR